MGTEDDPPGMAVVSAEIEEPEAGLERLYRTYPTQRGDGIIRPAPLAPSRSMQNGLSTTVPQNMAMVDFELGGHKPRKQSAWSRSIIVRKLSLPRTKESFEARCCKIHVLLVVMQLCLGGVITAIGLYMGTLSSTLRIQECPYWAGVPLLLAGIVGIYYCATDFANHSGSAKAFILKAVCFTLSGVCIFLCMVASVFPGINGSRISSFTKCEPNGTSCYCHNEYDPDGQWYLYEDVFSGCDTVITSIKDFFILQCALNSIASGVCLWFVTLIWKARYQKFHSGLKFYSYSANNASHPWLNPYNPPYAQNSSPIIGSTNRISKIAAQQQSPLLDIRRSTTTGRTGTEVS